MLQSEFVATAEAFIEELTELLFDNLDYDKAFDACETTAHLNGKQRGVIKRMFDEGIITATLETDEDVFDEV